MFQANVPSSKVDEHLLLAGAAWLVASVALAIVSGMTTSPMSLPHAYAFMAGFCGSSVMGLTYRLFPGMKASRMAKPQLWIWEAGVALLVTGRTLQDLDQGDGVFQFASIVAGCGALLFAVNVLRGRTIRSQVQP